MFWTKAKPSGDSMPAYGELLEKCARQEGVIASQQKELRALRLSGAPLPNSGYEWLGNLQYRCRDLAAQVDGFKSGEKYIGMKAEFKAQLAEKERENRRLRAELADANARAATARENWSQVFDDLEKEQAKAINGKEREIKAMENRALNAERQRDDAKEKLLEKTRELYGAQTELEEEREKNRNLKAQINRDHENSSKPSSANPNHKKITNTRVPSGKKPGGQAGHKHHPRKRHEPTYTADIPAPEEYADSPDYVETGKTITKQFVDIQVNIIISEYSTPEFRNVHTGVRVHADFPGGLVDDVTYSGNIKSFAFLLNSYCNVSIAKVSEILSELTDGRLRVSTGMICGLTSEFSLKTEAEQKEAFANMLLEPVLNTDFTTVRVNGKNMNAIVCATPTSAIYAAREHKGHEGVKGTPVETYRHTLVHDHDATFFNYGDDHQGCHDHILRYLVNSMENEPSLKWNGHMRGLIQEMIHFRKHLDPEDNRNPDEIDPGRVAKFELRFDEILSLAKEEYEYEPPSKYYMNGFNLYMRLHDHKKHYLLFLHDRRVPYSNSLSERLLRILKRKGHQVMAFRSFSGLAYLCDCLGTVASLRSHGKNLYAGIGTIFDRQAERSGTSPD